MVNIFGKYILSQCWQHPFSQGQAVVMRRAGRPAPLLQPLWPVTQVQRTTPPSTERGVCPPHAQLVPDAPSRPSHAARRVLKSSSTASSRGHRPPPYIELLATWSVSLENKTRHLCLGI